MPLSNRMKSFIAPDGYLYDWAIPHKVTIINQDGVKESKEEHLYVKYLYLSARDDINNYKLIKDPKVKGK